MKNAMKIKQEVLKRRRARVRAKVFGTAERPRLSVARTLKHVFAQLINDDSGKTLAAASDLKLTGKKAGTKTDRARAVGAMIAEAAIEKKIKRVVFDRSGRKYHGRIRALAEGAREAGLEF
ncbi:MAG: 50S ribosomal protein L18 [Patescibacteria group bacterium]|nr:50S ribosomal protein L18 [Patescibacteria group bacterium]